MALIKVLWSLTIVGLTVLSTEEVSPSADHREVISDTGDYVDEGIEDIKLNADHESKPENKTTPAKNDSYTIIRNKRSSR